MRIEEIDEAGQTVAVHHPQPETPPAETPEASTEPDADEPGQPRIERLLNRASLLLERTQSLTGTLLGISTAYGFPLHEDAEACSKAVQRLVHTLLAMQVAGVDCRSTPKSRAIAKLRPGVRVRFVDAAMAAQFCEAYRLTEMPAMAVDKVAGDHLWLSAGDKPVGRVRWSEVELDETQP